MKSSRRSMPLYFETLIEEKKMDELLKDYPHEVNDIYTADIYRLID
ncbi:hypothetical protein ACQKDD_11725 [Planococcus kocurii]